MIRSASSAASSGTAMRTSPSGLTDIGRMACGLPLMRNAAIPWLSSSASTTLASMSDVVLKTMTGGIGSVHFQQDQGQVIVEPGAADKRVDFAQDALAQLLERQLTMFLDERGKALFAE